MRRLEAAAEDAARRRAADELDAARSLEAVRAVLAAAQREAEVLRAGAGADKDSALAALKVPIKMLAISPLHAFQTPALSAYLVTTVLHMHTERRKQTICLFDPGCSRLVRNEKGSRLHLRVILHAEQAEQEHALAEGRKHAAAAQAHLAAELDAVRAKLAAATEQLEQHRRGHAASLEEERQAARSKQASMQVSKLLCMHRGASLQLRAGTVQAAGANTATCDTVAPLVHLYFRG